MNHNFRYGKKYGVSALGIILILLTLSGCGSTSQGVGAIPRTATVALPTRAPTLAPSPASTRVMPVEVLTPLPTRTITPIPDENRALVVDVIDGDTITVVMDGDPASRAYVVRYLGIEAPLATSPWGVVAYEKNRQLTNLKVVRLVRDETDFDAEGNLLRYVYVDNQLLSIILAEQGLAKAAIEEPNTRFEAEIREAESRAREGELGLWGPELPTPTATRGQLTDEEAVEATATAAATSPAVETTLTVTLQPTQTVTATSTITGTVPSTVESTPENTTEPTAEGTPESQ